MEQPGLPPVIPDNALTQPTLRRWRWWVHLLVLAAYPIVLGVAGALVQPGNGPMLPSAPMRLAEAIAVQLLLFALVFLLAWSASRASAEDLRLGWTSGLAPIGRG